MQELWARPRATRQLGSCMTLILLNEPGLSPCKLCMSVAGSRPCYMGLEELAAIPQGHVVHMQAIPMRKCPGPKRLHVEVPCLPANIALALDQEAESWLSRCLEYSSCFVQ